MRVTGPGRHIWISECMHACVCSVGSDSLGPVDCSPPFPLPGDLPTQGSNFHLLHCMQILYLLSHWDFSWIGVCVCVCESLSHVWLFVTPYSIACQTSLSMEFSRQYWSELPFPSPEELPNPGIKPRSSASQADSLPFELQGSLPG